MGTTGAKFFTCQRHQATASTTPFRPKNPYNTIDDATSLLHQCGPGALMAKADLKSAFRLCSVHPLDWPLLGIRWRNQYFVDKGLPFGLCSSPYLFNLAASFHYLDNFFFSGPPGSGDCQCALSSFQSLCDQLGVPLKPEKLVLPTRTMTFLRIQLDSQRQVASLPQDKLTALLVFLQQHIQFYREESTGGVHSYKTFASLPDRQALLRNQLSRQVAPSSVAY